MPASEVRRSAVAPPSRRGRLACAALLGGAVVVLASLTVAAAASLPVADVPAAGGSAAVLACDDAFTTTVTTSGGLVSSVTVGGIADPACEGGEISVSLLASGSRVAYGGPVTIPADGDTTDDSVVVAVTGSPAPDGIDAARIVVTGP